ncbi:MAG: DUF6515 family protein [Proteobacteria bacterium]|nr:DUF6515 family protein [Pseudomonadota bacterium]
MKHLVLTVTTGLLITLGTGSADAHPRHAVHGRTVVVEKQVVVTPAPVRNLVARAAGDLFDTVPSHHVRIVHQGRNYYVADGVFYVREGARFRVVRPVAGIRVAALPRGYTTVRIGGVVHYRFNDVTYRRVNSVYVVV